METEEVLEWVEIFAQWPQGAKEAHKRLLTRNGLPDINIPTSIQGENKRAELRSVLWKYLLLHKKSAFSNFYPPSVSDKKSRSVYYQVTTFKFPNGIVIYILLQFSETTEKTYNRSS